MKANILVTFDPISRISANFEVKKVLREIGEENPKFIRSKVRGLFKINIKMDPKEATKRLYSLCRKDSSKFVYTYHWIPVERWCPSIVKKMAEVVKEMAENIKPKERWRMRINKRLYKKHRKRELIELLTQDIDRPNVDLEKPNKTIQIEIIGEEAALSLLKPREHFSVNKVKKQLYTKLRRIFT
jgi:tRNA(Ser,Leu) C12 N-acetylase TAN1